MGRSRSEHLRGYASRFMVEVAANLYVGEMTSKTADHFWKNLIDHSNDQPITLIKVSGKTEQGYQVLRHGDDRYSELDLDGYKLTAFS